MFKKIVELYRYRELIVTLVSRDLKARYRGTVLGFLWIFLVLWVCGYGLAGWLA